MALNFPVDSNVLGFNERFGVWPSMQPRPYPKNPLDPNDPNYDPVLDPHNSQYNPNDSRLIGGVSPYVLAHGQPPTQQPSIPIQSPQGSPPQQVASPNPPRLQSAPNSPALIGGSPNMALTNGGGYPMGGLPTQSPMTELYQFNQMQNAQPLINGQPDLARMQRQQQNLQNFKQLLARLGGYSFQG